MRDRIIVNIRSLDRFIEIIRSMREPMVDEDSGVFRSINHNGVVTHVYRAGPIIDIQIDAIKKIEHSTGVEVISV